MRNILITVMMLAVVAFLFFNIVIDDGIRDSISDQGDTAVTEIDLLTPAE